MAQVLNFCGKKLILVGVKVEVLLLKACEAFSKVDVGFTKCDSMYDDVIKVVDGFWDVVQDLVHNLIKFRRRRFDAVIQTINFVGAFVRGDSLEQATFFIHFEM